MKEFQYLKKIYIRTKLYTFYANLRKFYKSYALIISVPKSGRTWLRFIISKVFSDFYGVPQMLDIVKMKKSNKDIPEIIFSHEGSDFYSNFNKQKEVVLNFSKYKNKRIIFLVRDPRDIIVSYYYQIKYRENKFQGSITEFIRSEDFGIVRIIDFLNEWALNRNCIKNLKFIKYEDMLKNTQLVIEDLFAFLDLKIDKDIIKSAVEYSSFSNMRKIEKESNFLDERIQARDKNNQDSYKVRKGKSGNYKEELKYDDINYVNRKMEDLNDFFGY